MQRKWAIIVGFMLNITFLVGIQTSIAADEAILKVADIYADANTLDPHRATGGQDRYVTELIFDGLLRLAPGNISADKIEPGLAKAMPSSEVTSDGKQVWTFDLRKGVMFHPYKGNPNGYELTAEDVVYSLERAADPNRSSFSGDYSDMAFSAADQYTVQVTLEKPVSPFLFLPRFANRAGGMIVCKKAIEENGEQWFKTNPVGTGPFTFKSYIPQEKVVMTRNDNYFLGKFKMAGMEYFYMPNLSGRELALQKGSIDVSGGPRLQSWLEKMEKLENITAKPLNTDETVVVHLNMSVKPLDQLKVRQAILYAINREEFVALVGDRIAEPIFSAIPVDRMVGSLNREEAAANNILYDYDLGKAKSLMKEAGHGSGFELNVFTSEAKDIRRVYEVMQAQLKKIDIRLNLSVVDHATFHTRIRENLDPIVVYICRRANPDIILTQFYHSASIVASGEKPITNFSHIGGVDADGDGQTDNVDKYIEAAKNEADPARQVEYWKKAQIDILKYAAAYPLYSFAYVFAWKDDLKWGYDFVSITDGPKPAEETMLMK